MEQNYLKFGRASEVKNSLDRKIYRFLEILPGFLSWSTIILIFIVSWQWPVAAAIFIILFDVYWLFKTVYLSLHLSNSLKIMRHYQKRQWLLELENLPKEKYNLALSSWKDLFHLIILPFVMEGEDVVRPTLEALLKANYPLDKFIVVLAIEGRCGDKARLVAEKMQQEFGGKFFHFSFVVHPADIEGEIAGKGSNETWATREIKKFIDQKGIDYKRIIVSTFDIDTVVPHDYFACLAYHYLIAKDPLHSSYQPIPIFTNNIWIAPALARIISFSTTFWQFMQQSRPERLTTFSSHSMPFQALADIDFWQGNVVSEDSRIFWQCYLHYGTWKVESLFYPVYMDANVDRSFWKTIFNQYKQQRRWAYGAENFVYFMFAFLKDSFLFKGPRRIPLSKKFYWGFQVLEGAHSWATNSLLILLLGWLPLFLGGPHFNLALLSFNLPRITRFIMTLASVGIITSAIISIRLLPPKPPQYGRGKYAFMVLQWILIPISLIFFGCLPALDAQTHLMLGKYMGFWVTPKHRE